MNNYLKTILFFILGVLFLLPLILLIDRSGWQKLLSANILYVILFFVTSIFFFVLDSLRWKHILEALNKKKITEYPNFFVAYSFSASLGQFVSQLGGFFVARPLIMKQKYNINLKTSVFSTVIEKAADLYFLTLLLISGIVFFFWIDNIFYILTITFAILCLGFFIYTKLAHSFSLLVARFYVLLRRKKSKFSYTQLKEELVSINMNYKLVGLYSIFRYFPLFIRVWLLSLAFGISIPEIYLLFGLPVSQLTMVFAITPGAMGFLEGGWFAVLELANISQHYIALFLLGQRATLILYNSILLLILTFVFPNFIQALFKSNKLKDE